MNDFTKQELEELWFFTELHKNKYKLKYPEEILNKLKRMIDNYCEHEHLKDVGASYKVCRGCAEEVYTDE